MYLFLPTACNHLISADLSVNKPAKDFMKRKFQEWYANIILQQMEDDINDINEPVDMRLSIMKPMVSKWSIEMYDHY